MNDESPVSRHGHIGLQPLIRVVEDVRTASTAVANKFKQIPNIPSFIHLNPEGIRNLEHLFEPAFKTDLDIQTKTPFKERQQWLTACQKRLFHQYPGRLDHVGVILQRLGCGNGSGSGDLGCCLADLFANNRLLSLSRPVRLDVH